MTRKIRPIGLALLGFWVFASVARAEPVSIALNWVPGGDHAALYYARKLGWYSQAGIDLSFEPGKGSVGSVQRVATGSTPFGFVDMPVVISAKGKGADVMAVMNVYANTALGFYWLKSSGIASIKDFPGKRIGVPPGDAQRALWPALAKISGVDPNSVTWVNVDPNGKIPALKSHAVDITTNFYNLHAIMSRELGTDMGYLSWAKAGVDPYGLSIVVNGDYLKAHHELVAKFVGVTQRAYAECVKTPQPCVEALIEGASGLRLENELVNWQLTMQLMSDKVSRSMGLGWMDRRRMGDDYALVQMYLGLDKPYDIHSLYTNEMLDPKIKMVEVPGSPFD